MNIITETKLNEEDFQREQIHLTIWRKGNLYLNIALLSMSIHEPTALFIFWERVSSHSDFFEFFLHRIAN